MAAQGRTFSECVDEALALTLKSTEGPKAIPRLLAENLRHVMHREGYAVHRPENCIRVPGPVPGREMTTEEMAAVGLEGEKG